MMHDKLIRGIGEVDDRILERYHDIDTRLARKHAQKSMALRMTAIAACLAVLLCAALPLSMLTHPVGRAVLKGDSEALMTELEKIEGFYDWQAKTAEKLEETLPAPMWELLQTTPVLDVLTQPQFKGMTPLDSFAQGESYRLYFLSNGDGTCALKYITTNSAYEGDFVIEIPETAPNGDVVTAIDLSGVSRSVKWKNTFLPYVLTPATMESLLQTAEENGISEYDYARLTSYFLKKTVTGLEDEYLQYLLGAFPITAFGDVYVLDFQASGSELNKLYELLYTYCDWNEEKYEQSVQELIKMAKKSGNREVAELCLTVFRDVDLHRVTGITIPGTVTSITPRTWSSFPNLETVTVAAEHPSLKMIDGCLVDTETGTLKLYLREDGKFPADADIRILESYAFSICTLQPILGKETSLHIPEGVLEIKQNCFASENLAKVEQTVNIYLPASLRFMGGERVMSLDYYLVIFHYAGTQEQWESEMTFGEMGKKDFIYLQTSDVTQPFKFYYAKK